MTEQDLDTLNKGPKIKHTGQSFWKANLLCEGWVYVEHLLYPFIAWEWPDKANTPDHYCNFQVKKWPRGLWYADTVQIKY
jgi:hypothetical protein